jgi:hypothetical protein
VMRAAPPHASRITHHASRITKLPGIGALDTDQAVVGVADTPRSRPPVDLRRRIAVRAREV